MSYLNNIDISIYQKDMDIKKVNSDLVIVEATHGLIKNPYFEELVKEASASKKKLGIYHTIDGKTSGAEEAFYFWKKVYNYKDKATFILKWEDGLNLSVDYMDAFLKNFYKVSLQKCLVYVDKAIDNDNLVNEYDFWIKGTKKITPKVVREETTKEIKENKETEETKKEVSKPTGKVIKSTAQDTSKSKKNNYKYNKK